jgi:hypothetical protein
VIRLLNQIESGQTWGDLAMMDLGGAAESEWFASLGPTFGAQLTDEERRRMEAEEEERKRRDFEEYKRIHAAGGNPARNGNNSSSGGYSQMTGRRLRPGEHEDSGAARGSGGTTGPYAGRPRVNYRGEVEPEEPRGARRDPNTSGSGNRAPGQSSFAGGRVAVPIASAASARPAPWVHYKAKLPTPSLQLEQEAERREKEERGRKEAAAAAATATAAAAPEHKKKAHVPGATAATAAVPAKKPAVPPAPAPAAIPTPSSSSSVSSVRIPAAPAIPVWKTGRSLAAAAAAAATADGKDDARTAPATAAGSVGTSVASTRGRPPAREPIVAVAPASTPVGIHAKLSSPERMRPSAEETARRTEMRLAVAEANRERLEDERRKRLEDRAARVRSRSERRAEQQHAKPSASNKDRQDLAVPAAAERKQEQQQTTRPAREKAGGEAPAAPAARRAAAEGRREESKPAAGPKPPRTAVPGHTPAAATAAAVADKAPRALESAQQRRQREEAEAAEKIDAINRKLAEGDARRKTLLTARAISRNQRPDATPHTGGPAGVSTPSRKEEEAAASKTGVATGNATDGDAAAPGAPVGVFAIVDTRERASSFSYKSAVTGAGDDAASVTTASTGTAARASPTKAPADASATAAASAPRRRPAPSAAAAVSSSPAASRSVAAKATPGASAHTASPNTRAASKAHMASSPLRSASTYAASSARKAALMPASSVTDAPAHTAVDFFPAAENLVEPAGTVSVASSGDASKAEEAADAASTQQAAKDALADILKGEAAVAKAEAAHTERCAALAALLDSTALVVPSANAGTLLPDQAQRAIVALTALVPAAGAAATTTTASKKTKAKQQVTPVVLRGDVHLKALALNVCKVSFGQIVSKLMEKAGQRDALEVNGLPDAAAALSTRKYGAAAREILNASRFQLPSSFCGMLVDQISSSIGAASGLLAKDQLSLATAVSLVGASCVNADMQAFLFGRGALGMLLRLLEATCKQAIADVRNLEAELRSVYAGSSGNGKKGRKKAPGAADTEDNDTLKDVSLPTGAVDVLCGTLESLWVLACPFESTAGGEVAGAIAGALEAAITLAAETDLPTLLARVSAWSLPVAERAQAVLALLAERTLPASSLARQSSSDATVPSFAIAAWRAVPAWLRAAYSGKNGDEPSPARALVSMLAVNHAARLRAFFSPSAVAGFSEAELELATYKRAVSHCLRLAVSGSGRKASLDSALSDRLALEALLLSTALVSGVCDYRVTGSFARQQAALRTASFDVVSLLRDLPARFFAQGLLRNALFDSLIALVAANDKLAEDVSTEISCDALVAHAKSGGAGMGCRIWADSMVGASMISSATKELAITSFERALR